jgi:hypothetical protein
MFPNLFKYISKVFLNFEIIVDSQAVVTSETDRPVVPFPSSPKR